MSTGSAVAERRRSGHLFHPFVDFLLAGGASIVILVPAYLLIPDTRAIEPAMLSLGLILSNVINYPHFAHSYQLLYAGIRRRIFGRGADPAMRWRYVWAGFVAPGLMIPLLALAYLSGDVAMLGYSVNVMLLLVGWHYVKQGFGVVIVLSAARRIFYTELERKVLLSNSYAVWFCGWLLANSELQEKRFFGVPYYTFDVPEPLLMFGAALAATTTVWLTILVVRRALRGDAVSLNGLLGYACALYFWVLPRQADPVFYIFIPAFHSLQYLLFVWRYQWNKARLDSSPAATGPEVPRRQNWQLVRFGRFIAIGIALGWLGFVGVPGQLDKTVPYDPQVWGPILFAFMFTVFINVHHYFIDNVIWRKENPDVRTYLFAAPRSG